MEFNSAREFSTFITFTSWKDHVRLFCEKQPPEATATDIAIALIDWMNYIEEGMGLVMLCEHRNEVYNAKNLSPEVQEGIVSYIEIELNEIAEEFLYNEDLEEDEDQEETKKVDVQQENLNQKKLF